MRTALVESTDDTMERLKDENELLAQKEKDYDVLHLKLLKLHQSIESLNESKQYEIETLDRNEAFTLQLIKNLKVQIRKLNEEIAEQEANKRIRVIETEKCIESQEREIQTLEITKENLLNIYSKVTKDKYNTENEYNKTQEALNNIKFEIESLSTLNQRLKSNNKHMWCEIEIKKNAIQSLEDKVKREEQQMELIMSSTIQQKRIAKESQDTKINVQRNNEELKLELEKLNNKSKQYHETLIALDVKTKKIDNDITQAVTHIDALDKEYRSVQYELRQMKDKAETIKHNLKDSNEIKAKLEKNLQATERDQEYYISLLQTERNERTHLESQKKQLESILFHKDLQRATNKQQLQLLTLNKP